MSFEAAVCASILMVLCPSILIGILCVVDSVVRSFKR
jgi:hypothetical protein